MLTLYYYPSTASMVVHILLEELGLPYERRLVDRQSNAHKSPEYLALNPNGLIPVLTDGDVVIYETAAITMHLCDKHSQGVLIPPLGSAQRAHFYQWLVWLTNTLQATLIVYFYPERWVQAGDAPAAAQVRQQAQSRIAGLLDQLDAQLQRSGGPWFIGEQFLALDAYVLTLCRWTRNFSERPARQRPHLGPYLQRMLGRAAVQRVLQVEGLSAPFV